MNNTVTINTWPDSQICINCENGRLVNDPEESSCYICLTKNKPDELGSCPHRVSEEPEVWHVFAREVWVRCVRVEAKSRKEAIGMVADTEGDDIDFEYVDTQDIDTWRAELQEEIQEDEQDE